MITKDKLNELCDAQAKLCSFCEVDECEHCIVNHLINDAYNECPEAEDGCWDTDENEYCNNFLSRKEEFK